MDGEKTDLLLTINWLILNYSMDMKLVCIFSTQQQYQFTRGKEYMHFFYKRRHLGRKHKFWEDKGNGKIV
jgi:hypothetical protein